MPTAGRFIFSTTDKLLKIMTKFYQLMLEMFGQHDYSPYKYYTSMPTAGRFIISTNGRLLKIMTKFYQLMVEMFGQHAYSSYKCQHPLPVEILPLADCKKS